MPNSYTASAYMGVKPIEEDFGDIAYKGAQIQLAQHAARIEQNKLKLAEAKMAQDRVDENLKGMDEWSAKALDIHSTNFDKEITGQMISDVKGQLADIYRELGNPNTPSARVIQLRTQARVLADNAANFVKDQKLLQGFIEEMGKVDVSDGWDSVLSGSNILNINKAIISAGDKGVTNNGDGTHNIGDFLKYKLDDTGAPVIMSLNEDGEWVTGTVSETVNKWRASMTPYVDLNKNLWDHAGEGIEPRVREFYKDSASGEFIEINKENNWAKIEQAIRDDFQTRFPNADSLKDLPKAVRKAIESGRSAGWNTYQDIENEYVKKGLNKVRDISSVRLIRKPEDGSSKGKGKEDGVGKNIYDFLEKVQSAAAGNKSASIAFEGKKTRLNILGAKGGDAEIEKIFRDGDDVVLKVASGYDGKDGPVSTEFRFDVNDKDAVKSLVSELTYSYNSSIPSTKDQINPADISEYIDFKEPVLKNENISRDLSEELKDFKQQLYESKEITKELLGVMAGPVIDRAIELGVDVKPAERSRWLFWNDLGLDVLDKDGDGVVSFVKLDEDKKDDFINELADKLTAFLSRRGQKDVNPLWIRRKASTSNGVNGITKNKLIRNGIRV